MNAPTSSQPAAPAPTHAEILAIHQRLDAGDRRMQRIEDSLASNTAATARVESNTAELLDWFASGKGAFKVLEGLGKLAKPLASIVGLGVAVGGMWATFKGFFK
ncbi:MAG: hypothetical protein REI11_19675 [Patulibacter sp.]|nr:hypothetical protein [Patulibacter sp.]